MSLVKTCDGCGSTEHIWLSLDVEHWASGVASEVNRGDPRRLDYCDECAPSVAKSLIDSKGENDA